MKKARVIAMLCATVMAAASFVACTPKPDAGTTSSGTSSAAGTGSTTGTPSGETQKVIWYQIGTEPADLAEGVAAMNTYTKDKINVEVDLRFLDWGVWADRIKTIVSTGEEYDMMFTNGDWYSAHVGMGAFADITDLIPTVAPGLLDIIPEDVWTGVKIKDRIYSVPTYKDSSQTQYWVYDKAMVDKYSIDYKNIKTFDELDPVLKKIKEGEGAAFYPFILNRDGMNGFLMYYDNYVKYDDATGTVMYTNDRPEVIATFKKLHEWYKAGIINPDAPTLTELPKYRAVYSAQGFPGADVTWSTNGGYEAISSPWSVSLYSTGTIMGSVNAISANSKKQEAALKYLELANTDTTLRNMLAFGVEGKHFKVLENKTVEKLTDTWTAPGYSQATFFTMYPVAPNPPDQWELVRKQNEEAIPSVLLGFTLDRTNIETELTQMKAIDQKYTPELYTGAKNPDELLPKYKADLEKAGLQKVLDETQKQVNAFLGK